ncbi:3-hydroxyacyl-CoA dehydrogenase family protein [Alicyclobacillus dauci]|uniref:3-hydroxyacyl-CoA dehydrogenase family protein n=1 Tax=Alicyclobacillus dauci TaxID=1475485 RepID=A0ABY6Z5J1_9BACL|nr:3-hydroxyacyl-CoA dehydrogenase family protein [Alicyclobacillus dauci]WAH38020.1 3-hydroxyacyl-CoA dehydrogenase family protein [Alicyclobacillus dauci]
MANEIRNLTVVGSGAMGSQIAMVCALAGLTVHLVDVDEAALERAEGNLSGLMKKRIEKGRLTEAAVQGAFSRLTFTPDLAKTVSGTDFVIEAIVEKLDAKQDLFRKLDSLTPAHTILATNSSTIVSSKLAEVTNRPDKVCNMHFFNPALVMQLVEVVRNPETSQATVDTTVDLVRTLGKTPVVLNKEISGFLANRILGKVMDEAIDLYEAGIASPEEIDLAVTKGLNHPIGPFALMDLTGIDVNYYVRLERYNETGDERDKPRKSIVEKFEKGELGRKTGKGWYEYEAGGEKRGL